MDVHQLETICHKRRVAQTIDSGYFGVEARASTHPYDHFVFACVSCFFSTFQQIDMLSLDGWKVL